MTKTFINRIIAVVTIVFTSGIVAAKSTEVEEHQMTEQQTKQIDDLFSQWNKTDSPGFALGIVKNGEFIYTKNYGMADVEKQIQITDNTIFQIASMTKQFTAAALVLLSEQGKLSLDDKLTKYFPSFPAYAEKITIRHLLNHTSGLRGYDDLYFIQGNNYGDPMTASQIVNLLSRQQELNFEPGMEFSYSNSGYQLAAMIVSKVSGVSFTEFVKNNILKPLKMTKSSFFDHTQEPDKDLATGYILTQDNKFMPEKTTFSFNGDRGLITTIADLKKWDDNFYASKIGGTKFVETMQTAGILNGGNKSNYALGLSVDQYKKIKYVRHGGAGWGFRSDYIRLPELKLSVVLFANSETDPEPLLFKIVDILLEKQSDAEINSKSFNSSPEELNKFCGVYINNDFVPKRRKITVADKKLHIANRSKELTQIDSNEFYLPPNTVNSGENIRFVKNSEGNPVMEVKNNLKTDIYTLYESSLNQPDDLLAMTGIYYCPELDVTYDVRLEYGKLTNYLDDAKDCVLEQYLPGIYRYHYGFLLKFVKGDDNRYCEMRLNNEAIKSLKFVKQK